MTRARLKQSGFTTIEIIIVVIIICILSGVILVTRKSIDQNTDNNERRHDIDALRVDLETYYSAHSQYPTLADMNNSSWLARNIKNFNMQLLRDPESRSYQLAATPGKGIYAYAVTSTAGHTCDDIKTICTQYTLTATLAGSKTTYVEQNLD